MGNPSEVIKEYFESEKVQNIFKKSNNFYISKLSYFKTLNKNTIRFKIELYSNFNILSNLEIKFIKKT